MPGRPSDLLDHSNAPKINGGIVCLMRMDDSEALGCYDDSQRRGESP